MELKPIRCTLPKARLPRKQKKEIIKASGRNAYWQMIDKMQLCYSMFGYHKFNIKKEK